MTVYVDSSAAVKLIVDEPGSASVAQYLDQARNDGTAVATGLLTQTELRRFAVRHNVPQGVVSNLLEEFDLYGLPPSAFHEAGILAGPALRSLDALHLVCALRIGARDIVTYDARQADAARSLGLNVVAPA